MRPPIVGVAKIQKLRPIFPPTAFGRIFLKFATDKKSVTNSVAKTKTRIQHLNLCDALCDPIIMGSQKQARSRVLRPPLRFQSQNTQIKRDPQICFPHFSPRSIFLSSSPSGSDSTCPAITAAAGVSPAPPHSGDPLSPATLSL